MDFELLKEILIFVVFAAPIIYIMHKTMQSIIRSAKQDDPIRENKEGCLAWILVLLLPLYFELCKMIIEALN